MHNPAQYYYTYIVAIISGVVHTITFYNADDVINGYIYTVVLARQRITTITGIQAQLLYTIYCTQIIICLINSYFFYSPFTLYECVFAFPPFSYIVRYTYVHYTIAFWRFLLNCHNEHYLVEQHINELLVHHKNRSY